MATAGDGRTPYQSSGAGGKLRKKPYRRSIPATPYDRPPTALRNNNPSLLTKIVDPASRLISAGAHRLFDVFRKRLPSLSLQGPPEINEEPQNVPPGSGKKNENSGATGISDVEQMLQEKTFTRSEIQRLTALLHSRTTESPSDDVVERDRTNPSNSPSSLLRREASTSGSLKKYGDERDNLYATISTPIVSPRVREEEIASPAELAKAYMGTRSTKVAPLFNSTTSLPKTPTTSVATKTANSFRNLENGFVTPRSRGRSAMYNMARTPYPRSPSVYTQKGIGSNYGQSSALTSSQSAFGHERKMVLPQALKRRSSVLDDDIGSGVVLRRTRQKANLLSQRDKRELGYIASQQPDINGQKLLLTNGPKENASGTGSGYGFVPTKSTQTATKILQQLEKQSPKGPSGSSKSPTKLTLNMLHGQALRSLEKVDLPKLLQYPHDTQKSEIQNNVRLHDNREPTSRGKEKVEENGSRKFLIPRNMLTSSVNGDLSVPIKDNAPIVTITDSPSKVPAETPQKKRAFQMSAPEDTFEINDDEVHKNGHVSFPLAENNKPETSLVANKPVSADVIENPTLPEPSGTSVLVENNKPVFPEDAKVPEQTELKETENTSSAKTVKFPTSPPSITTTEPIVVPQSILQMDKVAPEKESSFFSFGKTVENTSFQFSANEPSEGKPDATSDPKALQSTSVFSSVAKNNHVKFSLPDKEENGNGQVNVKVNGIENGSGNGKSESLFSAVPVATSKSVGFSFGNSTNNTSTPNATPVSNPTTFPSLASSQASSGANTTSFFNNTSHSLTSTSTTTSITTTTTSAASTIFSSSVPAPLFSFGSTTPKTSIAETGNNTNATNDKEPKLTASSLPFTTTSFAATTAAVAGGGLFGFSFPASTSATTGTQANTQATSTAVTQSVPFSFGAGSSSSLFGSSTPSFGSSTSFGVSSIAALSEGKSGNSTSGTVFGSTWPAAPQSSGFGSTFTSSPFSFGASSSTPTPPATTPITFGSSFPTAGTTNSSFATPSQTRPIFGNPSPLFGATTVSPNNNDQMSMEDSMAEDSMQTPGPIFPFGQPPAPAAAPGFMFGAAPTPTQPVVPFQFGGQPNQTPPQNPFQSSSLEFNGGGGSFSLGSVDKSGRRTIKVKSKNRRK